MLVGKKNWSNVSLVYCLVWVGSHVVITLNHGSPITSLDATVHIAAGPQRGSRRGLEQSQQHSVHTLLGVVFGIAKLARNLQGRKTMSGFGFQSITTKKHKNPLGLECYLTSISSSITPEVSTTLIAANKPTSSPNRNAYGSEPR